jgi:hypothetical protein
MAAPCQGGLLRFREAPLATYNLPARGGIHKTLTSTTADVINIPATRVPRLIEVLNRSTANPIYVRGDSTTAVAAADGTTVVPKESWAVVRVDPGKTLSVVGNGDAYSVDHA